MSNIVAASNPYNTLYYSGVPLVWGRATGNNGASNGTTDVGGTSLCPFLTAEACCDFVVHYENYADTGSGDSSSNPITFTSTLQYPAGTFYGAAFDSGAVLNYVSGGQSFWTLPPWQRCKSVPIGAWANAAGLGVGVSTYVQIALPPTLTGATSTTGGTLTAATRNYTASVVCGPQGESGPSSTLTLTSTGSTSSDTLNFAFNVLSVPNTAINVYVGSLLLITLPPNTKTWVNTGAYSVGTKAPVSAQVYPFGAQLTQTVGGIVGTQNYGSAGGNGSNQTLVAGFGWGNSQGSCYTPCAVHATPVAPGPRIIAMQVGDSILQGYNSTPDQGYAGYAFQNNTPAIPYHFVPRVGAISQDFVGANARMKIIRASVATDVIEGYGINDTWGGISVAGLQTNLLLIWQQLRARGVQRIHRALLSMRCNSTDSYATYANMFPGNQFVTAATNASPIVITSAAHGLTSASVVTIGGVLGNTAANGTFYAGNITTNTFALYSNIGLTAPVAGNGTYTSGGYITPNPQEVNRIAFNTWLMDGAPMNPNTFAAVAVGTANGANCVRAPVTNTGGTVISNAGYGNHLLASIFNPYLGSEYNAAGTAVLYGGRWPTNGTANTYVNDGTHPNQILVPTLSAQVPLALMNIASISIL